jgi:lipoteichoic acid synthase
MFQGQQKYIYHFGNQQEEYYQLKKDPLEKNNLIGKVGKRELDRFRSEVLEWHAESTAAYPQPARS